MDDGAEKKPDGGLPAGNAGKGDKKRAREARQAAALRENLRKRKRNAQRRAQQAPSPDSGDARDR